MTPEELRAIRERCEAATPGPWFVHESDRPGDYWTVSADPTSPFYDEVFDDGSAGGEYGPSCSIADRDFLVAARTDVPALLDEVDRLRSIHPSSLTDVLTALEDDRDAAVRERDEARTEAKELREVLTRAGERLKACSYGLTEFSYQEMASVLFDLPCNTEEPTNG